MDSSQNSNEIREHLIRHPEWESFVQTTLQETNDKNNTQIGGVNLKVMMAHKAEFVIRFLSVTSHINVFINIESEDEYNG